MEKFVYQGHYIKVSEAHIEGQVWEKVFLRGGVSIFPITENKEILIIEEKRPHETPAFRLKTVTGIYEPEYSFEENVNREMQEEIGFKASKVDMLKEITTTGTINNFLKVAVAWNLSASKVPNPDGEDTIQKIIPVSLDQLFAMTMNDQIHWSLSTLGIFALYHNRDKYQL